MSNIDSGQTPQMSVISSTNVPSGGDRDEQWMAKYSHLLQPPLQIGDQVRALPDS